MSEKTPTQQVSEWLAALGAALERGDAAGAAALFGEDELLARPGLVHLEHHDRRGQRARCAAMLEARLTPPSLRPGNSRARRSEAGGVIEAWIRFETGVARGRGHLRLRRRQGLDAADDDDRAEGLRGAQGPDARPRASSTACTPSARPGSNAPARKQADARLHHAALRA